jgi:hypothetical protein
VAHQLVDDARRDRLVLEPGGEGVTKVVRPAEVDPVQVALPPRPGNRPEVVTAELVAGRIGNRKRSAVEMVPRPLAIEVEHRDVDGHRRITIFERGVARLVAHELDHLNGVLYWSRMRKGVEPIPVAEYRGGGQGWRY